MDMGTPRYSSQQQQVAETLKEDHRKKKKKKHKHRSPSPDFDLGHPLDAVAAAAVTGN